MSCLKMGLKTLLMPAICSIMLMQTRPAFCEKYLYGFGVEPSYSSGDYGTGDDVDIFYLPLVFKFYPADRVRGTIVLPWVHQSSTQVVSAGGSFNRVTEMNNIHNRKAFPHSAHITNDAADAMESQSGLGDMILRGEYDLVQESSSQPAVILEAKVKLPTASESKGLGTGELDAGAAVEIGRTVKGNYVFGRFGYTVVGEPSGADFNNPFLYEAGIGFPVNPQTYLTASLEGRTSIDDNSDNPLDAVLSGNYRLRPDLSLNGFLSLGLSDGSPDFAIGIGFLQKY